jgi:hypothetical protein
MSEWGHWYRAFPPSLRCATSRGHAAFLSVSHTDERHKKPRWLAAAAQCHNHLKPMMVVEGKIFLLKGFQCAKRAFIVSPLENRSQ